MKKICLLLIAVILTLCSACSGNKPSVQSTTNTNGNMSPNNSNEEIMVGARQEVGDFIIEIKSYRMTQTRVWTTDYDIIVVSYEWTNNSGGARSFEGQFQHYAFQNGIACNEYIFAVDEDETSDINDPWREVQSGKTQIVQKAYELHDTTSDVSIEVGTRDGYLAHTIVIDATQPSQGVGTSGGSGAISSESDVFGSVLDEYISYINSNSYTDCAYALYDIDGNGVDELLVRYNDGEECTKIYTYANSKTNEIGEYWSRKRLLLDGSSNVYSIGSNGYASEILELARISDDGTALITIETWEMDGSIYSHNSINGLKVISEKEFQTAVDKIYDETDGFIDSLNWQPLPATSGSIMGSANSNSGEILYKGESIASLMGIKLEKLNDIFGAPVSGTPVDGNLYNGGEFYGYNSVSFIADYRTEGIGWIIGAASVIELDGVTFDKTRTELIDILGEPGYEAFEEYSGDYVMEYVLWGSIRPIVINIAMSDSNEKAHTITMTPYEDGISDEEYQDIINDSAASSSDPVTADGNALSVGSLVYAKQSVNYVRGYVTSINSANSVNVAWDTVLENNLWGFTECAIFSDSYSISGYSYSASSTGTTVQLVGLKFNLPANELYSKRP